MTDDVQATRKNEEMPEKMTETECTILSFEYVGDRKSGKQRRRIKDNEYASQF